jgi:McKusick-Kaufman syndrome protein
LDFIRTLLLQAFISSLPVSSVGDGDSMTSYVRFVKIPNADVMESEVFANTVLLEYEISNQGPQALKAGNSNFVALYDVSLQTPLLKHQLETSTSVEEGDWSLKELERKDMESFCTKLKALGVRLVVSQKLIHPYIKRRLADMNMMGIERLSLIHIGPMQSICGAQVVSQWNSCPSKEHLGIVREVHFTLACNRSFITIKGMDAGCISSGPVKDRIRPVSTVLLCSPNEVAMDEMHHCVQAAIQVLSGCANDPCVLAGGGCTEVFLAKAVREAIATSKPSVKEAAVGHQVAACLAAVAGALNHDPHVQSARVADAILHSNDAKDMTTTASNVFSSAGVLFGWDAITSAPTVVTVDAPAGDISQHAVVDSRSAKRSALDIAFEAALTIIRLKAVVATIQK